MLAARFRAAGVTYARAGSCSHVSKLPCSLIEERALIAIIRQTVSSSVFNPLSQLARGNEHYFSELFPFFLKL